MELSQIFCPVRKKKIAASPEELVRQKLIQWLVQTRKVPLENMLVEWGLGQLEPGNMNRVDLVVMKSIRSRLQPWILCECKAPGAWNQEEWRDQIQRYLRVMSPRYVIGTDGSKFELYENQDGDWHPIANLPIWG